MEFIATNIETIFIAIRLILFLFALSAFVLMIATLIAPYTIVLWHFGIENRIYYGDLEIVHRDSHFRQGDKMLWRWYLGTGLALWGMYSGLYSFIV